MSGWPEPRTRGFWLFTLAVFGGLELVLRIKLGSIFTLIGLWVLVHHWLLARLDPARPVDLSRRLLDAFYFSLGASAIIFAGFFIFNAIARSFDEGFRFFQLP
jgi:hypothetical protein